jgi:hypothetical protein
MHQNRFLTAPDVKNYLFKELDSGGLEMLQNTFLTTSDVYKYLFKDLILVAWKCIKTRFYHSRRKKKLY